MFWKTKKEEYRTTIFGVNITFSNFSDLAKILEKASGLQDQNRRDYNMLFERQNLILDHLKLKYVPETETKEPAKLVEKTVAHSFFSNLENGAIISLPNGFGSMSFETSGPTPTKPKKKGRPKK